MSYILDALRRADAERRRGHAPVLQDMAALGAPEREPTPRASAWRWPLLALMVLAAVALGWLLAGPAGGLFKTATDSPAPGTVGSAPTPATPSLPSATGGMPPEAAAAQPPLPPLPPAPVVRLPAPPTPEPAPVPAPAPALAPSPQPASALAAAPAAAPAPPAAASAERVTTPLPASALPEPQRSAVARLALGGAVYSPDRQQRFVLLAGQIVREGATLAPGIVLERIEPRALVLRVDERRVRLPL